MNLDMVRGAVNGMDNTVACAFYVKGDCNEAFIAGTFLNDWRLKVPMTPRGDGTFMYKHDLGKGVHLVKFILDTEWQFDPNQPTLTDSSGNINNVCDLTSFDFTLRNAELKLDGQGSLAQTKSEATSTSATNGIEKLNVCVAGTDINATDSSSVLSLSPQVKAKFRARSQPVVLFHSKKKKNKNNTKKKKKNNNNNNKGNKDSRPTTANQATPVKVSSSTVGSVENVRNMESKISDNEEIDTEVKEGEEYEQHISLNANSGKKTQDLKVKSHAIPQNQQKAFVSPSLMQGQRWSNDKDYPYADKLNAILNNTIDRLGLKELKSVTAVEVTKPSPPLPSYRRPHWKLKKRTNPSPVGCVVDSAQTRELWTSQIIWEISHLSKHLSVSDVLNSLFS